METVTKKTVLIFCPDCLALMHNGTEPNIYRHARPNEECAVTHVELEANGKKIRRVVYDEGFAVER